MLDSIRCWLLGHDDVCSRSFDRLSLRCLYCQRETRGWRLTRPDAPRPRSSRGSSMQVFAEVSIVNQARQQYSREVSHDSRKMCLVAGVPPINVQTTSQATNIPHRIV